MGIATGSDGLNSALNVTGKVSRLDRTDGVSGSAEQVRPNTQRLTPVP